LFFLLPFAYGSAIGLLVLIASLLLKKFHRSSTSKIPTYIGIIAGLGILIYSLKVVRGFEGAMVGLVGITAIIESAIILFFLHHLIKKEKNLTV
jgi:hypothetical protein